MQQIIENVVSLYIIGFWLQKISDERSGNDSFYRAAIWPLRLIIGMAREVKRLWQTKL